MSYGRHTVGGSNKQGGHQDSHGSKQSMGGGDRYNTGNNLNDEAKRFREERERDRQGGRFERDERPIDREQGRARYEKSKPPQVQRNVQETRRQATSESEISNIGRSIREKFDYLGSTLGEAANEMKIYAVVILVLSLLVFIAGGRAWKATTQGTYITVDSANQGAEKQIVSGNPKPVESENIPVATTNTGVIENNIDPVSGSNMSSSQTDTQRPNVSQKDESEIENFIEGWKSAWESRNIDEYMAKYAPNFEGTTVKNGTQVGKTDSIEDWRDICIKDFKNQSLKVDLGPSKIEFNNDKQCVATFAITYTKDTKKETGTKSLTLERIDGVFKIVKEVYKED